MPQAAKTKISKKVLAFATVVVLIAGIATCIAFDLSVYWGIFCALFFCALSALYLGHSPKETYKMLVSKLPNVKTIVILMGLIGATVGLWMRSGVLGSFVHFGLTYLSGFNMVLAAFLMCSAISIIIGSAFGALSTVGIVFVGIGRALGIPMPLMAGAIISGCYLGDRTAPLSATNNLIAAMTGTDMPGNLKYMARYTILGVSITAIFCAIAGAKFQGGDTGAIEDILTLLGNTFHISVVQLIPLIVLIVLIVFFKCTIVRSLLIVLALTFTMAIFYTKLPLSEALRVMLFGFHPEDAAVAAIISGSGIAAMLSIVITVVFSTLLNGILDGTGMINILLDSFNRPAKDERHLMINAAVTSDVLSIVTCNQSLCTMATGIYFSPKFDAMHITRRSLAHIISDNGIIISPLIPWNINAIMAVSITGVGCLEYVPFSTLCLILPLFTFFNMWRAGTVEGRTGLPILRKLRNRLRKH